LPEIFIRLLRSLQVSEISQVNFRNESNDCQSPDFLYCPSNATWAHNDDFLAFTVNRERRRLDFDERFEAFLFSIEAV
jgi:hypothetical protein